MEENEGKERRKKEDIYIYIYKERGKMFANGIEDQGSISGRVMPKTQKWYLLPPCSTLSIKRYGSRVKWSNPEKEETSDR